LYTDSCLFSKPIFTNKYYQLVEKLLLIIQINWTMYLKNNGFKNIKIIRDNLLNEHKSLNLDNEF